MSVLASLVRAYERLADRGEAAPFGYSPIKIGFVISLNKDGSVAAIAPRGDGSRKSISPLLVPQPAKKSVNIAPNFLWGNSSYVLGVTGNREKAEKKAKRLSDEHAAFVRYHLDALSDTDDVGLSALRVFLSNWKKERFLPPMWPQAMLDQDIAFALESERRQGVYLHNRPAARELWKRLSSNAQGDEAICLVSGERAPVARLHPRIKGIRSSGGKDADSIVSFNFDASESYGHKQGHNAPVSESAAFAYTTALNKFLERDSGHRIQIGDATTVFWADASDAAARAEAEAIFAAFLGDSAIDERLQAGKVGALLEKIRAGRPAVDLTPDLHPGVRFYVLGLSPNAARLSVRFWLEDDFGVVAERFARHANALRIEPPPKGASPGIWRLLIETAPQRKSDNIPPNLAGEWLRAILTGTPYPLSLLATVLMRLRADKDVNALRAAILKATLTTQPKRLATGEPNRKEVPVSLDPENKDPGYMLGRLFAAYEYAQTQALGGSVNATIRDKYYGTASATPRAVFPLLQRGATHHLSKLRKERPGMARWIEDKIGQIFELADPDALFVPTLTAQRQALFAIGYYHQRNDFYRRREEAAVPAVEET